jgi:hypothetical protein
VLTRHVCVVLLFFCPPPPLGKGEAEEDISPSLSFVCLYIHQRAPSLLFSLMAVSFHIFIGTHTYVCTTISYSGLFSLSFSLCLCVPSSTVFVRMKATRGTDSFVLLGKPKVFLFSFSLLSGALSLLRLSSPYRMTLSLIPVCVCVYTYMPNIFFYYYYSLFYSLILFELDRIV